MIIYKTTNLINGKIYIGQFNGIDKYYIGGGKYFKRAVKKYGRKNFKFEILTQGDFNIQLTDSLEIHYIQLYNATNKKIGYNIAPGGGGKTGFFLTQEHKDKISKAHKGKIKGPLSEEHKLKLSKANKGRSYGVGRKNSQEFKDKCRLRKLGTKLSTKTKLKMSLASLGKPKLNTANMNKTKRKPILQYDLNMNFIKEWTHLEKACKELKISIGNTSSCCNNKRPTSGGFKWKFKIK